jgi:hypothetical protein
MYDFFETAFLLAFLFATFSLAGYGVAKLLLPRRLDVYMPVLLPLIGYPTWVLATHFASGTFQTSVSLAGVISLGLMLLLSVATFVREPVSRSRFVGLRPAIKDALLLMSTTLVVLLWPLFYIGAATYVASVNPDFFLGLLDNHWLLQHPTTSINFKVDYSSPYIFEAMSGSISESARYRGAFVAILLEALLGTPQRTGLAVTLGFFYLCMPLAVYFMARVALNLPRTTAVVASLLLGISSSLALSYISYYIGQTSVMAYLPALLTFWYLFLNGEDSRIRLFFLGSILTGAVWVSYTGMIPYLAGPIFIYSLILIAKRKLNPMVLVGAALGFVALLLLLHANMLEMLAGQVNTWMHVVNLSSSGFLSQYYLDFVTERFFPMFYGLTIYTMESSIFVTPANEVAMHFASLALSVTISIGLAYFIAHWFRNTQSERSRYFAAALLFVYAVAYVFYVFYKPYGYASFKHSMWFQFLLMLFAAYGLVTARAFAKDGNKRQALIGIAFLAFAGAPLVIGNIANSIQYGHKGLGRDVQKGYMVVAHGVSGNKDYMELTQAAKRFVKPDESIGISLNNIAQNSWGMYYLRGNRLSYLGSWAMPGDEENLPDRVTRVYYDPYGNPTPFSTPFYHGPHDDYYLVNQPGKLNADIFRYTMGEPVWQNDTFALVRSSETKGFLFSGHGLYRAEFRSAFDGSYLPRTIRWSARGAEFFMVNPEETAKPHRISMTVYAGFNATKGSVRRTIDFYHNGKKIGEGVAVNGFARVVSDEFIPADGENLLRFEVREKVRPIFRRNTLWNHDLPSDYRELNVWVADVRVETQGKSVRNAGTRIGQTLAGSDLFDKSYSFNGVEPNYWSREELQLQYVKPPNATKVRFSVTIPQVPGAPWPQQLSVTANGRSHAFEVLSPGDMTLEVPLQDGENGGIASLKIVPGHVFTPKDYPNTDNRDIVQGLRLNSLVFL